MAVSLVLGAAIGAAFGELLKAVLEIGGKAIKFKQTLADLRSILEAIEPVIKKIEQQNIDLGCPKEELESLTSKMKEGTKLVHKCSEIHRRDYLARSRYNKKLEAINKSLAMFFIIHMQTHMARDQKETLFTVRKIYSRINKFPLVNAEDTTCSSFDPVNEHEPAEKAMKPPTNIAQESTTKAENNQATEHMMNERSYEQSARKRLLGKIGGFNRKVKRLSQEGLVVLDCFFSFDINDLRNGSIELIGKGSYGKTYKAILKDGRELVVKRLRKVVEKIEFEKQVKIMQTLISEHPNVIPIRAYYYGSDEMLLIYDYMMAGSFSRGTRDTGWTQLDWDSRMKIAHGAAAGIAHIHSVGAVHGNIKSSNILVTKDMQGCISDFGLTRLTHISVNRWGNKGYRAPELVDNPREVTQKCDVYSFGVLLLEMLNGELPVPNTRQVLSVEKWTQLFYDPKHPFRKRQALQMVKLAKECLKEMPYLRPSMPEVLKMMEEIIGCNKF